MKEARPKISYMVSSHLYKVHKPGKINLEFICNRCLEGKVAQKKTKNQKNPTSTCPQKARAWLPLERKDGCRGHLGFRGWQCYF
jgi:hypothetical protein